MPGNGRIELGCILAEVLGQMPKSDLLVSYVAGPYPDDEQSAALAKWLDGAASSFSFGSEAMPGTAGVSAFAAGPGSVVALPFSSLEQAERVRAVPSSATNIVRTNRFMIALLSSLSYLDLSSRSRNRAIG